MKLTVGMKAPEFTLPEYAGITITVDNAEVGEGAVEAELTKLRFAHAETIIPLVALMKLEGSRQGAEVGTLMTQDNNEWRGGWVSWPCYFSCLGWRGYAVISP